VTAQTILTSCDLEEKERSRKIAPAFPARTVEATRLSQPNRKINALREVQRHDAKNRNPRSLVDSHAPRKETRVRHSAMYDWRVCVSAALPSASLSRTRSRFAAWLGILRRFAFEFGCARFLYAGA
jgi:hypothetical protein